MSAQRAPLSKRALCMGSLRSPDTVLVGARETDPYEADKETGTRDIVSFQLSSQKIALSNKSVLLHYMVQMARAYKDLRADQVSLGISGPRFKNHRAEQRQQCKEYTPMWN